MKSASQNSCGSRRKPPLTFRSSSLGTIVSLLTLAALAPLSSAQQVPAQAPVGFSYSRVNGLKVGSTNKASKVTSLQFGPDNKLYYLQSNGTVWYCTVNRLGKDNYDAVGLASIDLVKNMPNYNDDGTYNPEPMGPGTANIRQATGLLVTGTPENPVIYVTSSDPREGAGSGAYDLNLDTNSGVISRLTKNGSGVWEKVDIVRGLPRSEENHATNGLSLDITGTKLLVAQGGSTNAGSPSNNFAFACEQALAAAVLSVDLSVIEAMPVQIDAKGQKYLYNLPTVNDPTPGRADVPGNPDYADLNDPFGGNDGLNQARIVQGGPVQVFAAGFRNPYDVMIAKTPGRVGKTYTFDNAANSGWGGYPKNEGLPTVTNEWVSGEPGTVNNHDSLQLISQGYYGGHPNPIRANPTGAGWLHEDGGAGLVYSLSPTVDWPPVPASMADSRQSDFKLPGSTNAALWTNTASTCGIAEYTASNFGGAMVGNIITAQFSAGAVQRIVTNADGTQALSSSIILGASGYGNPLDIAIPGPGAAPALAGTIFVAHYLSSDPGVTVLEPTDFDSAGTTCTGANSYTLDEDSDGYSNADEILNNADACSPAVRPKDFDADFLSDLLDTDDDNDGISDSQDAFPIDALNGANVGLPLEYHLFNTIHGFFSIGFTGVMIDPGVDYTQRIDDQEIIAGGTAGLYTDPSMGPGSSLGASNSQMNAFQFGVNVDQTTGPFRVISGLGGLLFNGTPTGQQSQGIYVGNGDQDNYVKVAVNANGGPGAIEVVHEENGVVLTHLLYPRSGLFSGTVQLTFLVDPLAGTVQPGYAIGSGDFIDVGPPLVVGGAIRDVLRGSSGLAVGLLGTTGGVGTPTFNATWDYFKVLPVTSTASASLMINSASGSILSSSTNSGGSFQLSNTSTGGQKIVSVTIDISTAAVPDVVFDPNHTAGDSDGTGYEVQTYSAGVAPAGSFEHFHNGVNSLEGYDVLRITCDPNSNFGPGTTLGFSSDIDPTSVKGLTGPGPNQAGSINGLELSGTMVTVTFDDGTVRCIRTGGHSVSGFTHSNKTSYAVLEQGKLTTPVVSVPGKSSPYVANTQPVVRVAGPTGSTVKLWVLHASMDVDAVLPPYDLDPFEANNVVSYDVKTETIGAAGYVDFKDANQVTLTSTGGGINYLAAVLLDANGKRSSSSNVLVIDYDPNATDDALLRVNAGGPAFTDSLGHTWAADNGFTSGSTQGYANPIAGTEDDTLYQTFRYDDSPSTPLDYSFQVQQNGNYQVKLHFAETWSGITAPGMRVFDVELEGQTVLDNYDVYAVAGPNTARVETFQTAVNDGNLTIGLRKVTQNPFINAIEVYYLGGGTGPDIDPPTSPSTLASSNLKSGSLTLTWLASTDNVAVTGYRIFRDAVDLGTTTSLSFPQTGLTPSTEYNYQVEAFDAAGNVSTRASLAVTTPADTENPTAPVNFKALSGNQTATLSWLAATDDTAVTGYRVYRDGNLLTTVTTLGFSDSGLTNGTNYTYEVVAIDATGKTSTPVTGIVRPRAIIGVVYRIDCGLSTGTTTDSLGNVWSADTFHNGVGLVDTNNLQIAGTDDDVIYRTRRYDGPSSPELKYTLPVANGDYELRLHFAETTSAFNGAPGQRVFDVKVQNQLAVDNLDMVASVGYATALVIPVPVTVTNGSATVEFIHTGLNNPVIAGIELYELEPPPPDTQAPTEPGSLGVTGTTSSSVSLAWTASSDNVDVTGYRISRNGGAPVTVTGLSYTDTGLAPGVVYNYSVTAVDAAANVSSAATVQGTTLPDVVPPTTPGSFVAASGNGSANLSWQASTDDVAVTGYRIYKDNVLLETVGTLSYTATGLTNETTYVFKVAAIDAFSNESVPAQASVTPRALGPVAFRIDCGKTDAGYSYTDPSGNVWARDEYFNANNTSVTTVTSNITGTTNPEIYKSFHSKVRTSSTQLKYEFPVTNGTYEVRLHFAETSTQGTAAGYRQFNVLVEGSMALQNLDVFAEAGGQYKALVKILPAVVTDGKVTLDFQNAVPTAIQNPFVSGIEIFPVLSGGSGESEPPTTPGNLQASAVAGNSVTLGWTASTDNVGVTGYRIYRNAVLIDTVTGLSYTNTGLTPGTLYHYSVVAVDLAANASPAATLDVTTTAPDTEAPSVPSSLAATPGLNQIGLTWNASTDNVGVTGYKIYRAGSFLTSVSSSTFSFTDTGLTVATSYAYEVIAVDAANNASAAAQINTATLADTQAPTVPSSLGGTPGYTSVALTWQSSTDNLSVTGYRIYRGPILVTTVATPGYTDQDLIPGTSYHFEVVAIDAAGNASAAATLDTATIADTQAPGVPPGFDATPGDQSVVLSWAAATDNVAVVNYEVRRNNVVIATVGTPGYTDNGLTNGVLYTYQVRALDAVGNVSAPASDSAKPRALGANYFRVDAGYNGPAFQDQAGNTWTSDNIYAVFGTVSTSGNAIAGTLDDSIYQTERYDSTAGGANLSYDFVLPAGEYEVRLLLAETYANITGPGQRVFDVKAEDQTVIDDLDIYSRVGSNTALVVTFPITVNDGFLDLEFIRGAQNPKVCGIEIYAIQPPSGGSQTYEQWLTSHGLTGQTGADSDGGGLDNLEEFELQMNPNDPQDDFEWVLTLNKLNTAAPVITLPVLKPIGNYYLHRSDNPGTLNQIGNRIDTITKAEIQAMTPAQRANYTVQDSGAGPDGNVFYRLFFEPVSE